MTVPESTLSYRLNSPGVVCDVVDGEVVIVHLETGVYYSTDKAGFVAWEYLNAGHPFADIVGRVTERFTGDQSDIAKQVGAFVAMLAEERLIVVREEQSAPTEVELNGQPVAFEGIELHKFRDMEDLLLLDPVHEVTDQGWPHKDSSK